jgi:APA family basic amino acid/polyamine antiporter
MAQKYTRSVATNMVIANMIGTGIFTSLGFQVVPGIGIPDPFAILVIWLVGGIISLCGATVYGEIATTINKSGGEYTFLTKLYHPLLGFISGWISIIIGFSAAIAGLSIATGEYFLPIIGSPEDAQFIGIPIVKLIGALVIAVIALVQMRGVKVGGMVQNYMTYIKLGLVFTFLALPLIFGGEGKTSGVSFAPSDESMDMIFSLSFAGSLVWVMFAYSGWNASSYIVGNLENPKKNLPFSLMIGTLIVTVLYLLLNAVFMYVATFDELAFQVDLGNVVAEKLLGGKAALFFSAVFSLALFPG